MFGRAVGGSRVSASGYFIRLTNISSSLCRACHLGENFGGFLLSRGNIVITGSIAMSRLSSCLG